MVGIVSYSTTGIVDIFTVRMGAQIARILIGLLLLLSFKQIAGQNYGAFFTPEVKKGHRTTSAKFMKCLEENRTKDAMKLVGPKVSRRKVILLNRFVTKSKDSTKVSIMRDFDGDHVSYLCRYAKWERWYSVVVLHFCEAKADAKIDKVEHKNAKQVKREWKKRVKSVKKIEPIDSPKLE